MFSAKIFTFYQFKESERKRGLQKSLIVEMKATCNADYASDRQLYRGKGRDKVGSSINDF